MGLFKKKIEVPAPDVQKGPDQRTFLKVKIKHLTAESRIIRQEEMRAKREARKLYVKGLGDSEARKRFMSLTLQLRRHRKDDVGEEARWTHLAYACIRGTPYKKVESKLKELTPVPDEEKIAHMVSKYGPFARRWFDPNYDAAIRRGAKRMVLDWLGAEE